MILLTRASRRLKAGEVAFNTLIIGGNRNALDLYHEIMGREKKLGYRFQGFIDANGKSKNRLQRHLPRLGAVADLATAVEEHRIEEVIIAIETSEHNRLREILNILFELDGEVLIKIIPDMYDIMLGTVQMNPFFSRSGHLPAGAHRNTRQTIRYLQIPLHAPGCRRSGSGLEPRCR
jgi:FlaA1/EpsC-like NDP-sugar epimerase